MTAQLDMFAPSPNPARTPPHRWHDRECPSCHASPGEPCSPVRPDPFATIHGQRTR